MRGSSAQVHAPIRLNVLLKDFDIFADRDLLPGLLARITLLTPLLPLIEGARISKHSTHSNFLLHFNSDLTENQLKF